MKPKLVVNLGEVSPQGIRFGNDGTEICVWDSSNRLTRINAATGKVLECLDTNPFFTGIISFMDFLPASEPGRWHVFCSALENDGQFLNPVHHIGFYRPGVGIDVVHSLRREGLRIFGGRLQVGKVCVGIGREVMILGSDLDLESRLTICEDYMAIAGLSYNPPDDSLVVVCCHQTGSRLILLQDINGRMIRRKHVDIAEPVVAGITLAQANGRQVVAFSRIDDLLEPDPDAPVSIAKVCVCQPNLNGLACYDIAGDIRRDYVPRPRPGNVEKLDPVRGWMPVSSCYSVRHEPGPPAVSPDGNAVLLGLPSGDLCVFDIPSHALHRVSVSSQPLTYVLCDSENCTVAVATASGDVILLEYS